MNPRPMTNDSDRVAPDHPIHLPGPTPVRPRRRIAAGVLSVLLGLSCFAASPTWAYRAGGGNDRPSDIKTYANVNAYIVASDRPNRGHVEIAGTVYPVSALEVLRTDGTLTSENLPTPVEFETVAVGRNARAGRPGAVAIGQNARAGADPERGCCGDPGTVAVGQNAWAGRVGAVAIGKNSRAHPRTSIALGHVSLARGRHSTAIGDHSQAHGTSSTALGVSSRAQGVSSIALGHHSYALVASSIAIGQSVIARGTDSIALGRIARADGMDSIALGRDAGTHATGTKGIAIGQGAKANGIEGIAIGSGVQAGANEVVVGTERHTTYKLPGLAPSSGTRVVTVDSNGRLSTQTTTTGTASSRGAALRGAAGLSSEVTAVSRTEAADYEKAPAIGSGPTAPATAEQRRVVVQDTNRDGSVRLRTLDFGDLSGMEQRLAGVDRRVTSLSERLNKATAMSSALSALPNVVPGDNRFFLGVGAGHYSSEQALAIGMSARVQSRVFVNAGVALASGDEVSVRGGVGVVW